MLNFLQTTEPNENMLPSILAALILLGALFLSYRLIKNMTKRSEKNRD